MNLRRGPLLWNSGMCRSMMASRIGLSDVSIARAISAEKVWKAASDLYVVFHTIRASGRKILSARAVGHILQ